MGIFVGVLALSLANCSSKYKDDCQAEADCEGGNDADVDACVDRAQGAEDVAGAYDCGDQFDDYFDCITGKGVCENKHYNSDKDNACKAKDEALSACVKAASAKGNNGLDL